MLTHAEQSILVLIDIQERLAAAMPAGVRQRVIDQVGVLLTAANTLELPMMVTEQYPKGLGVTEPALKSQLAADVQPIEKTCFSCAKSPEFMAMLEKTQRKHVILTGMETHICVLQTALELQAAGYQVFVVEDAVSSRAKANQYNALYRMRQAGVIISTVESVLFEWLGDARHQHFKAIAKLIV